MKKDIVIRWGHVYETVHGADIPCGFLRSWGYRATSSTLGRKKPVFIKNVQIRYPYLGCFRNVLKGYGFDVDYDGRKTYLRVRWDAMSISNRFAVARLREFAKEIGVPLLKENNL